MEIWKQDTSKLKGTTLNIVTKAFNEYRGTLGRRWERPLPSLKNNFLLLSYRPMTTNRQSLMCCPWKLA